jgi:hypothetical protein
MSVDPPQLALAGRNWGEEEKAQVAYRGVEEPGEYSELSIQTLMSNLTYQILVAYQPIRKRLTGHVPWPPAHPSPCGGPPS